MNDPWIVISVILFVVTFIIILIDSIFNYNKKGNSNGYLIIQNKADGKVKIILDLHDKIEKIEKQEIVTFTVLLANENDDLR